MFETPGLLSCYLPGCNFTAKYEINVTKFRTLSVIGNVHKLLSSSNADEVQMIFITV